MKPSFRVLIPLLFVMSLNAQSVFEKEIFPGSSENFHHVLSNMEKYEIQIIYTRIDRNAEQEPIFSRFDFNVDPQRYFYPASSVKFPAAILALEYLNNLNIAGLDRNSRVLIDSAGYSQSVSDDPDNSVSLFIEKILLVSDNDAFNRLYEILGQDYINKQLASKGFKDTRIIHRLSVPFSFEENKRVNPVKFFNGDKLLYELPFRFSFFENSVSPSGQLKGKGFMSGDKLLESPMDFSSKNFLRLETLHEVMKSVVFPDAVPENQRFNLTPDDYNFLYEYMCMLPRESDTSKYNYRETGDQYVKFFNCGYDSIPFPANLKIFSKSGLAYEYLIDNAYIIDTDKNVEFLLSAVIHVNDNGIFNDDTYEYDKTGLPFLSELSKLIYEYECSRQKEYVPDLTRFR